ncbi:Bug family tripartite tricarboxylate transporter substrate binding protein [Bradyrhizobium liaoningense]|uniref:Bug family tripartite tricarboxylate transporter substrate binding protein n=1 Tax=Bradyrhizobium liaoningense TaxID=43992 RepID=UPI001BA8E2DC|nr:tripartite tricarboxylate transporter substrate binding protein [Bradyrhizobium liaoningense]MBR0706953.1 tripartite tricarboxylate transporter substrate binding protein [Bradyrhizobium liaoningense]
MTCKSPIRLALFAAMVAALHPFSSCAADDSRYPSKIIKIIVPFPAGGTADSLPRIVAEKLRQRWGLPVIIENKTGAGGNIGAEFVANSAADGYTLLASPPGPIAINEGLYRTLGFRPSDLRTITLLGTAPNVIDVRNDFPAKTVHELIDYARANPDRVTFASQGNGSTSHLTAMLFQRLTDTRLAHVPYRGTAPALQDLMAGTVDLFFDNLGSSLSLQQGGAIRIIAVCSPERTPSLADVPTVREAGVSDFSSVTWFALMAPKNTPQAAIDTLNSAVTEILRESDVKAKFEALGVQPAPMNSRDTEAFISSERARWGGIIRSAQIEVQ